MLQLQLIRHRPLMTRQIKYNVVITIYPGLPNSLGVGSASHVRYLIVRYGNLQVLQNQTNMIEAAGQRPEPTCISSLPPELLAAIFEMALSKRRIQYKLPFEVVLSHVSSFWRAVAITTPALWTRIDIYSSRSECAAKYLQRSGSMLLDIRVDIYNADKRLLIRSTHKRDALIQSIVKTLFPHIHRARSLLVLSSFELTALKLLSHLYNSIAPHLRRLRMNIGHPDTIGPRTAGFKAFGKGLPQLTFLETDLPDCVPLSLQNLTTLHLHTLTNTLNLSYQSFLAMITAPPSLRNLSIQGSLNVSLWPFHTPVNGQGFSMNNLEALRLPDDSMFSVKILLTLSAPNLVSLWLGSSFDNYGLFFPSSPNKFPALKYLTIPSYDFSYNTHFPRAFPSVTHLYLPYVNVHYRGDTRFKFTFTSNWKQLDTLATGLIRQTQTQKFHADLCHFLPLRRDAGYPIRQLLVDDDLCRMLKKGLPDASQYVKVDVLSLETYQEPWWIMSHERHMDHPWYRYICFTQ